MFIITIIYNSQDMTTSVFTRKWMDKGDVAYLHNEICPFWTTWMNLVGIMLAE